MPHKTERLQRLLNEGYCIDFVDSDDVTIEATLRRGSSTVVLTFEHADAGPLLFAMLPHRQAAARRP